MELLVNPVRGYAWGSRTTLAALQRRPVPSPGPEAELWVGAHPGDPSRLAGAGTPLTELVATDPAAVLGAPVRARFGDRLPFLLKVLAAAAPLSMQAHPDAARAAAGYEAEQAAGVPAGAPHRRYPDPYHKPELLVAVTGFRTLCGFAEPTGPAGSGARLAALPVPALAEVVAALRAGDLPAAVAGALATDPAVVAEVAVAAAGRPGYEVVTELAAAHPGDPGVVLALLLNEVTLRPGEAVFLPPGNLHAALGGTGVEVQAASDNVLRGGLTGKHVDVPELLRVLRYEPLLAPVRQPVRVPGPGGGAAPGSAASGSTDPGSTDPGSVDPVVTWPVPVPDFALHRVRPVPDGGEVGLAVAGPRAVLCLAGEVRVDDGVAPVKLRSGEAALARATNGPLRFQGSGEVYVASVGSDIFCESA